jgi:hypothetical protein
MDSKIYNLKEFMIWLILTGIKNFSNEQTFLHPGQYL